METKTVFGEGLYQAEILLTEKVNSKGKKVEDVSLQLFQNGSIKLDNGRLVSIDMSKDEARELAIQLLKTSSVPVPQNGLHIENHQGWGIKLHQTLYDIGIPDKEPLICIDGIQDSDIPEDGSISICLTNKAGKEMISALAMIV